MSRCIQQRSLAILLFGVLVPAAALPGQERIESIEGEPYEVGLAQPPVGEGAAMISLTLEEAVQRALESNLDIQSARLDPQIQSYALESARAAFNPSLNISTGYNNSVSQSTTQLDGGDRTTRTQNTLNMSLNQPLNWQGAELSASFNNARTETSSIFATRNPSYSSTFSLNYTQPLLAGRRIDNQRNQLRTQEIQREITNAQLRAQVNDLTAQVRNAYWNLRYQIEQIEIQRRSLAQAEQLLADNQIRVQQGTMVEMDLAQAEAQVAAGEQALLNAEIQWRNQELAFKRLLVSGGNDPLLLQTIVPSDLPEYAEVPVNIEAALETAMQNRPDLQAIRQQREVSDMNLDVTRDNAKPSLNLTLSYSLQGVGGNLFDRQALGGEPVLVQRGGYTDGLSSIAGFDTPSMNASLNFSYPLGTSAADNNLEQARLQLRQSDLNLQSQRLLIEMEVTNAGLAVQNAFLQLEAARRSREAAERSAEAELTRFSVGVSTNFQVVTAQNTLTSARLSELQATIGYINAIAEFERVQGIGR